MSEALRPFRLDDLCYYMGIGTIEIVNILTAAGATYIAIVDGTEIRRQDDNALIAVWDVMLWQFMPV